MVLSELLAPAGSYDVLVIAVNAGADAVYIAGQQYGARSWVDKRYPFPILYPLYFKRYSRLHGCAHAPLFPLRPLLYEDI